MECKLIYKDKLIEELNGSSNYFGKMGRVYARDENFYGAARCKSRAKSYKDIIDQIESGKFDADIEQPETIGCDIKVGDVLKNEKGGMVYTVTEVRSYSFSGVCFDGETMSGELDNTHLHLYHNDDWYESIAWMKRYVDFTVNDK